MKQRNEISSSVKSTVTQFKDTTKPVRTTTGREAQQASVSADERHRLIAEAAYYRALARGFTPGGEVDDWLQAETEIEHVCTRK